jgi:hypothetical protein
MIRAATSQILRRKVGRTVGRHIAIIPSQFSPARRVNDAVVLNLVRSTPLRFKASVPDLIPKKEFDFNTLVELQSTACEVYATNPAFGTRIGDKFEWISYAEFGDMVQKVTKSQATKQ